MHGTSICTFITMDDAGAYSLVSPSQVCASGMNSRRIICDASCCPCGWRARTGDVETKSNVSRKLRRKVKRILQEDGVVPGEERIKDLALGAVLIVKI